MTILESLFYLPTRNKSLQQEKKRNMTTQNLFCWYILKENIIKYWNQLTKQKSQFQEIEKRKVQENGDKQTNDYDWKPWNK
jgi:hypothetical protein